MLSSERGIAKKFYKEGETVFAEGETGGMAFIVETGSVGIFKELAGTEMQLATMTEGELFGEMAVIDGSPRMANARALEDTVAIQIPRDIFENKIGSTEPFFRSLIQILMENLRGVHRIYMKRPRSVNDYLSAVSFHTEGMRSYLESLGKDDQANKALIHITEIETAVQALGGLLADHADRRGTSLGEADVTRRNPQE